MPKLNKVIGKVIGRANKENNTVEIKSDMSKYYKDIYKDVVDEYVYGFKVNTTSTTSTKPVSTINIKSTEKKIKEMIKDNSTH